MGICHAALIAPLEEERIALVGGGGCTCRRWLVVDVHAVGAW